MSELSSKELNRIIADAKRVVDPIAAIFNAIEPARELLGRLQQDTETETRALAAVKADVTKETSVRDALRRECSERQRDKTALVEENARLTAERDTLEGQIREHQNALAEVRGKLGIPVGA